MISRARKVLNGFFAVALALICAVSTTPAAYAAGPANLALNKEVTVNREYNGTGRKLTDGDKNSKTGRWMTESTEPAWAVVDLGKTTEVDKFVITWEDQENSGKDWKLYVSDSKEAWGDPVHVGKGTNEAVSTVTLDAPKSGRYVKLDVTAMNGPYGISVCELEVMNTKGGTVDPEPADAVNLALKKATKASVDYHNENGARAVDGKKKDGKADRWMTETKPSADQPQWLAVDLGKEETFKYIEAMWENAENYSTAFKVYASSDEACWNNPATANWGTPVYQTANNKDATSKITLEQPATGRYVKLEITQVLGWGASCMEFEVWNEVPPAPAKQPAEYLNDIKIAPVTAETQTLQYELPEAPEGYEIKYNGTDYEQVIGLDGTIFHPIANVTVKASFKITNKKDSTDYAFKEFDVTVPGTLSAAKAGNAAPSIVPELREWVGGTGSFAAASAKRVVFSDDSLKAMADEFASDFQAVTGVELSVVKGTSANAGDIFFTLTTDKSKGLQDEGYLVEAKGDKITVTAEKVAGANWGAKTILQGMKTGNGSFPVGTARDYPLYKVRGLILDVGRKTFTMDWLQQMTKQMAWFKLNDFHVHLNDNYIPLEEYTRAGKDVFQAYNAFRLESSIKEGGNDGKNKADLTAKDVWYTKAEFKDFIEHSAALGVNIIPEIDTPAHSLSLTKVRPDLRHGTDGRQNDHLNLTSLYNDSLAFVQSIFDEYVKGGDTSTFAGTDTIHIGADEYSADGNAYRRFVNDMFKYAEDNGKTARVWGSLTTIKGDVNVSGVSESGQRRQMDLWNPGWADMKSMYDLGFELIDCQDGVFYIVPNAGYYYDYLSDSAYTDPLNGISGYMIPAGDPQILGGSFAVWNDMCDNQENGMSEYDIYDRINRSAGLFGANGWGKGSMNTAAAKDAIAGLGDAPNTNFGYNVATAENGAIAQWSMEDLSDASGMKRDLVAGENAAIEKVDGRNALKLNGEKSFVSVKDDALTTIGLGNDLRVKVKRTSASTEPQVLFESEYGQIMAVQKGTGKVGITRENRAYSFNYTLPLNDWVELEFKNKFEQTELWVNGKLVDTVGTKQRAKLKATNMFPVNVIGSKTNAFQGYVDDVRISTAKEFNSTMELDYAVVTAESVLKSHKIEGMRELLDQAYDVFKQMDPSAEVIADLTAKINALLEKTEFDKADYCRIDAYAQLQGGDYAETLADLFTDDSVATLQMAWGKVRSDLPASMQETVDGYTAEIVRALDGLKPKASTDLTLIDPATLVAKDSSHQGGDDASKTLDGNLSSMWHSDWSITTGEHWVTLTGKAPMDVDGIQYTPRQTGTNGNIQKYRIEVSTDGTSFTKVKEGDLKVTGLDPIMIKFDRQNGVKAVKLVWVKANNGNGAAAELRLSDAAAAPNFDRLKAVIAAAELVKQDGPCKHDQFTKATWNAMQTALSASKDVLASQTGDVNAVYSSAQKLAEAIVALRLDGDQYEEIAFVDVDKNTSHADHIVWLAANGISKGWAKPDGTFEFRPYATVKRADMAAFLYRLAGEPKFDADKAPAFTDVDKETPHRDAIQWLAAEGISTGFKGADGKAEFRPYAEITRCDMAAFLYRLAGEPKFEAKDAFADVTKDTPHREAVLWLAAEGVSTGFVEADGTKTFRPYAEITRCDMAAFLHRMAEKDLVK